MGKNSQTSPVTIGDIKFTPELIEALEDLKDYCVGGRGISYFAKECLGLAALGQDNAVLDPAFFMYCNFFYATLEAIENSMKGGNP